MRHNQSTNVLLWRGGVSFVVHCNILWFLIGLGPSTRYKPIDFGSYLRSCFVQSLGASKLGPRAALPPRVASTFLSVFCGVLVQLCFHDIQCFSEAGSKFAERPTVEDSPQRLTKKISMKANLENSWDLFPNGYPKHPKVATMETRPPYSRVLARGCRVWKMRSQESADTSTGCTAGGRTSLWRHFAWRQGDERRFSARNLSLDKNRFNSIFLPDNNRLIFLNPLKEFFLCLQDPGSRHQIWCTR